MATYDSKASSIVLRLVYDGSGLAGKTRTLRWVRQSFANRSGRHYVPEENATGRTLYFDWLELDAGRLVTRSGKAYPLRVELMTVPGQSVYVQRRWLLLRSCDAVISVVDSTPAGLRRSALGLRFLRAALEELGDGAPPLVVQANKQDLPDALGADSIRRQLALGPEIDVVETSAARGDGVREALLRTLQRARAHVAAGLGDRAPTTLPAMGLGPEALYQDMREAEANRGDLLEGEILADRVLGELPLDDVGT